MCLTGKQHEDDTFTAGGEKGTSEHCFVVPRPSLVSSHSLILLFKYNPLKIKAVFHLVAALQHGKGDKQRSFTADILTPSESTGGSNETNDGSVAFKCPRQPGTHYWLRLCFFLLWHVKSVLFLSVLRPRMNERFDHVKFKYWHRKVDKLSNSRDEHKFNQD